MKQVNNSDLYIVSESEIEFKSKKNPKHARSKCPVCMKFRTHPEDTSVSWDLTTGVGYCFHCQARFKIDNHPDTFYQTYGTKHQECEKPGDYSGHLLPMDDESRAYLEHRCISEKTAIGAGVCSRRTMNGGKWQHWLAFPFLCNGELVNVQYKKADIKDKGFFFESGGQLVPWNIDCIGEDAGNQPLVVTEGMMDALAVMECGLPYVVSVPNGAGSDMKCFDTFREFICSKFEYILFAGDTDSKGMDLRREFCRYFDDIDVCCVNWVHGDVKAKDANELLMKCGRDAVTACLKKAAVSCPDSVSVMGDDYSEIDSLYESGMPKGNRINLPALDKILHFQPGSLLLVTGYPGSGKSTLVNFFVASLLRLYGWRTLFFSPEKLPQKYHERELISLFTGKNFDKRFMPRNDFEYGKRLLKNNIMFLHEEVTDIEDIIAAARSCVRTYHIKVLVIDPFIYLDLPAIPGASETHKIGIVLKRLMRATRELDVQTILVAHPRKPSGDGPVEPSLYEVSGSASFYNFCDAGIILERIKGNDHVVRITCGKARREFNGAVGMCQIAYDGLCGRYVSCITDGNGKYTTEFEAFNTDRWKLETEPESLSLF